jgi:hypothetical protein
MGISAFLKFMPLFFLLICCKGSETLFSGVKNPGTESPESISAFLYTVNCEKEKSTILNFSSLTSVIFYGITPSSVYVFDKKSNQLKLPGETNKCSAEPAFFIQNLSAFKEYKPVENSFKLKDIQKWLLKPDGTSFIVDNDADFTVFIFWAVWTGKKIFLRDILSCIDAANNNKDTKIDMVLINMDKQFVWGEKNLKRVKFTKTSMQLLY